MCWCAVEIASAMRSSGNSRAKPSIICTDALDPDTITFRSLVSSWSSVGNTTKRPSIRPRRTEAIGPKNGKGETASAADAPIMASTSGSFCRSAASTKAWIWTSSRNHSGNKGRMGRSISREVRTSRVVGRPSRLRNPPGNRPAAATRSR